MLHRVFALLIVGFWLAMTSLLVVREMYPEASRLNNVPTGFVANLLFQHTQATDLQIYDAGKDIGYVHVQPRVSADKKTRTLEFHGNLMITPLGSIKQQISWIGHAELTPENSLRIFHVNISTQAGANHLDLELNLERRTAKYEVRSGGQVMDRNTVSLDQEGLGQMLRVAGLDAAMFQAMQTAPTTAPSVTFTAQQSSTRLNGESVSTYLVTMSFGQQTVFDAHVSQLGQVLRASTPLFAYKLAPYNVKP